MRLAVVGSRNFTNYEVMRNVLDNLDFSSIRSGGAFGADKLAEQYAEEYGYPIEVFKPDWNLHGKAAGFIRNTEIWNASDFGVAFWNGKSKGTAHSFEIAKRQGKTLWIWNDLTQELTEQE